MIRKCRFTKEIIYYYRKFSAGLLSNYEIECRLKDQKAYWVLIYKFEYENYMYCISKEEAKKYIEEFKKLLKE